MSLNANLTKWSNTLPTNCLRVFGHFVGLAFKELRPLYIVQGIAKRRENVVGAVAKFHF